MDEQDGPGWEMQEENERMRWDEERIAREAAGLDRCQQITEEQKRQNELFEQEWREREERIRKLGVATWR